MIKVTPLDDEAFGAVVSGIVTDHPLTDDTIDVIKDALAKHTAIVINDLDEAPDWLLRLGRGFGSLEPHILDQFHHPGFTRDVDHHSQYGQSGKPNNKETCRGFLAF